MKLNTAFKCYKSTLVLATMLGGLALSQAAFAQGKGVDDPLRAAYKSALSGRTVALVPVAMGNDLAQGWTEGLKKELEPMGVKVITRDPNWNTSAGAQAITTLISEKPDVLIVHNPDVQTYSKLLQRAEETGIRVVQVNMRSNFSTVLYVGADWVEIGEKQAAAVVQACKGKSNKVAIVQGAISSAASAYTLKGIENIFSKTPDIKVVSSQAADWDAVKAKGIMQTVLKQHPDLCGAIGFWENMDTGTAAAIKEAGLTGKVFLATSGAGEQKSACDQVKAGTFDLDLSYDVPTQAANMASSIKTLLQMPAATVIPKSSIYSTLIPITKSNASIEGTCWRLNKT